MKKDYNELFSCPITLSKNFITYLDFGLMPLVNNLNNTQEESLNCQKYPLAINYYPESKLSMLSVAVDPKILFSNYVYKSGTSKPYVEHCSGIYDYIQRFISLKHGDYVIDIGGNDGTLLEVFMQKTINAGFQIIPYNVDPSENLTAISRKKGLL